MKNKKNEEKRHEDEWNKPPRSNGVEAQGEDGGNNNNSQITGIRETISARLDRGEDNTFKKLLLLSANNNNDGFYLTEPDKYSLLLSHSKELWLKIIFDVLINKNCKQKLEITIKNIEVKPPVMFQNIISKYRNEED